MNGTTMSAKLTQRMTPAISSTENTCSSSAMTMWAIGSARKYSRRNETIPVPIMIHRLDLNSLRPVS